MLATPSSNKLFPDLEFDRSPPSSGHWVGKFVETSPDEQLPAVFSFCNAYNVIDFTKCNLSLYNTNCDLKIYLSK